MIDEPIQPESYLESLPEEDKIFTRSMTGHTFQGQVLKHYSPARKMAANSMGMLYPFVGEDGSEQLSKTGVYAGAMKDTAIVLWLCSIPDTCDLTKKQRKEGQFTPSTAIANPKLALEKAIEWAEERGILDPSLEPFQDAMQVFMAIVSDVERSKFKVESDSKIEIEGDSPKA